MKNFENLLIKKLVKKVLNETHEKNNDRYMFFSNLEQIHRQTEILLQENENGSSQFTKPLKGNTFMGSSSFVFQTPIGPLRATLNYFPKQDKPFQFQASYGYVLFNERAIR